jgi:hypothetical protein
LQEHRGQAELFLKQLLMVSLCSLTTVGNPGNQETSSVVVVIMQDFSSLPYPLKVSFTFTPRGGMFKFRTTFLYSDDVGYTCPGKDWRPLAAAH